MGTTSTRFSSGTSTPTAVVFFTLAQVSVSLFSLAQVGMIPTEEVPRTGFSSHRFASCSADTLSWDDASTCSGFQSFSFSRDTKCTRAGRLGSRFLPASRSATSHHCRCSSSDAFLPTTRICKVASIPSTSFPCVCSTSGCSSTRLSIGPVQVSRRRLFSPGVRFKRCTALRTAWHRSFASSTVSSLPPRRSFLPSSIGLVPRRHPR
mmetsp:Transcript_8575/g.53503  ORF Transcript_8575/g.53503 Transcript_8575/m.53503 type:complete len:207 (+) Transcript_8575:1286-1906(+)